MLRTEHLLERITVNQKVMVGKPTVRGMRITVEQILRAFSRGISEQELLEEYPELEQEDFRAVFAYVTKKVRPKFGSAAGRIEISDDFDEPLEGFEAYMP
ncbi:MAG: DUF433 domain-containing protein [Candidatus Electrothrix sp. AUS1_2]|nr:DUF433 domain-containing protein [Candidatus Electrothrix sp. AUS1_2]